MSSLVLISHGLDNRFSLVINSMLLNVFVVNIKTVLFFPEGFGWKHGDLVVSQGSSVGLRVD
ncbi:MAG: hypothetical protein KDI92_14815 [Xanthomonadales bacterium]|nr:hypothetical protein [Xanthomonadales bacterium]